MNALDSASAEAFQEVRGRLQTGPWYTGQAGGKGFIVTETVNGGDEDKGDGIQRYTDRYLQRRRIGRNVEDFPFDPRFLPAELYKAVGMKPAETPGVPPKGLDKLSRVDRLTDMEDGEAIKKEDDNEENDEENEEELEDEFEEVEDDDYNAEKYFDDGDEEGEADDGDNEAAY